MKNSIYWIILVILTSNLQAQVGRNFKVTEFGILNYVDSKNVVTESVIKDKVRMDKIESSPMLKIFAPKEQKFDIDTTKKNEVVGTRGTRFTFPENAFVDNSGKPIEGNVNIFVTEVIDELDFLTAGIGLVYYNKYGKEIFLVSGGMFRIEFKQGENKVLLAPDKTIEVQFPDLAPKENFSLYHMDETGIWNLRSSLSNNDKIEAGTIEKNNLEGRKIVGVRIAIIDKAGYWNFAYPELQHTCLKGTVDDSKNPAVGNMQISLIVLDVRAFFSKTIKEKEFSINAYKKRAVKILITDEKGSIGISNQISTSDKTGTDKTPEGNNNFRQAIGNIELKKFPEETWKDEKQIRQILGFPQERYYVKYRK